MCSYLRFNPPEDGIPVCEDWIGTFESMVLGGIELQREPLDISMIQQPGWVQVQHLCTHQKWHAWEFPVYCSFWLTADPAGSWLMEAQSVDQVKGWTRSSVVMLILTAASELDLSDSQSVEKLRPLFGCLDKAWLLPCNVFCLDVMAKALQHISS